MLLFAAVAAIAAPGPGGHLAAKARAMRDAAPKISPSVEVQATRARLARLSRLMNRKAGKAGNPLSAVSIDVSIDADEATGSIAVDTTLVLAAEEDGVNVAELYLDNLGTLTVTDGDANALDVIWVPEDFVAVVTLPATLNANDTVTLHVSNAGVPACDPDDFFGMTFCYVSEQIVFTPIADWLAVPAPYLIEELYMDAAMALHIETPPGYIAVTTADLVEIEDLGDRLVHHFEAAFPVTYVGFAYAPFETFDAVTPGGVPVTALVHTGALDFGQAWADISADIIDFYESVFSPYIFNKHDVVQTIDELGGGVGPQSATFYYASALTTDPENFSSESIFSHEIGHQWWGNMIRLGDTQSPWLNEGFAEYSSRLYGYEVWPAYYQDYLYEFYFRYFQIVIAPDGEATLSGDGAFSSDSLRYQAATYWKGAHFLRILEWLLGDDFFVAMSEYASEHSMDAGGALTTVDAFREKLEEVSGRDLTELFERWAYGRGFPIYSIAMEFPGEDEQNPNLIRVRIKETQSGEPFDLPVEVALYDAASDEPGVIRLPLENGVADVVLPLDGRPRGAAVDPSFRIWGDKVFALAGDVDGSNVVDGLDLVYAAWTWGGEAFSGSKWNYFAETDFNRDGIVDDADVALVTGNFGREGKIDG